MALTKKRRKFIDEYLKTYNASQAAINTGTPAKSAYAVGWEMLRIPEIAEAIEKRLSESAMSANEVLMRLGEQARAEYSQYIEYDGIAAFVNLARLLHDNKGHLIKSIKDTKYGQQIEFYDSQSALATLAKHHGLLVNRVDQRNTNIEIDLSELTDDQLKRLAAGESIAEILAEK